MTDTLATLDSITTRLTERGYVVTRRNFSSPDGLLVHTPAQASSAPASIAVIDDAVFLYSIASGWQARITPHGGPHWIQNAATLDALFDVALAALQSNGSVPSGWVEASN